MKKFILALTLGVLITLLTSGCSSYNGTQDNDEPRSSFQSNTRVKITNTIETVKPSVDDELADMKAEPSESAESDNDSTAEAWQEAYAAFLSNFSSPTRNNVYHEFGLRDLDNNGIPELIVIQADGYGVDDILTAYSNNGNVYKIGDYSNPKIGVAGLRISDNPVYPGLFTCWWGGGVEHYGYLAVKEEKLIYEDLWYDDHHTEESPGQVEISSDKQLIKESIDAHPPYDYTENLLEMHLINDDNINEILGK